MRDILFTIILSILVVTTSVAEVSCQVTGPRQTLNRFSEALKSKDKSLLLPFLTNEPDYVRRTAFERFRRKYKLPDPVVPATRTDGDGAVFISGGDPKANYVGDELVTHVVPIDLFFEQSRSITKIVSISEHGKEAFAKVELEGSNPESGSKYAALLYDILLYKEEGGWKIFLMKGRNPGDEKYYDDYDFYANPTENAANRTVPNEAIIVLEDQYPKNIAHRDALLKQPAPHIRFVFDCSAEQLQAEGCADKFSTGPPPSLAPAIGEYWQESLKFSYRSLIETFPDTKTDAGESMRFSILGQRLRKKLSSSSIITDQGERMITEQEAWETIRNINVKASELVRMMTPPKN